MGGTGGGSWGGDGEGRRERGGNGEGQEGGVWGGEGGEGAGRELGGGGVRREYGRRGSYQRLSVLQMRDPLRVAGRQGDVRPVCDDGARGRCDGERRVGLDRAHLQRRALIDCEDGGVLDLHAGRRMKGGDSDPQHRRREGP